MIIEGAFNRTACQGHVSQMASPGVAGQIIAFEPGAEIRHNCGGDAADCLGQTFFTIVLWMCILFLEVSIFYAFSDIEVMRASIHRSAFSDLGFVRSSIHRPWL